MKSFLNFASHCHYVLLSGEFIILSELDDEYILLGRITSRNLLTAMTQDVTSNSGTVQELLDRGIVVYAASPEKIVDVQGHPIGIDNYEWRLTNEFIPREVIINPVRLFRAISVLYKIKTLQDVGGIGKLLNIMRKAKKDRTSSTNNLKANTLANNMLATLFYAEKFFLRSFHCLEISTALFLLLSKYRVSAEFVIGVQKYDFLAHAWVEIDGTVCGDMQSLKKNLAELVRI